MNESMIDKLQIRFAVKDDVPLILSLIRELAEYEHLLGSVVATEDILREWLFEKEKAEVIIGEWSGEPVAYALFFNNFSTFLGRSGLYLEDIYVRPEMRGKGIGKRMLKFIAELAVKRDCGRLEWACLDWNARSISFYLALGAEALSDWTTYRLSGDALIKLAKW